jgi:hypothetical protein
LRRATYTRRLRPVLPSCNDCLSNRWRISFEIICRRAPTPQGFPRGPWLEVPLDHEAGGSVGCPCSSRSPHVAEFVPPVVRQECPESAGALVGQRQGRNILVAPGQQAIDPVVGARPVLACADHRAGTMDGQGPKIFTLAEIALGCIAVQGNNVGSNLQLVEIVSP